MEDAFGIVLFTVVGVAAVIAVIAAVTSGRAYEEIGKGGLELDRPPAEPTGAAAVAIRDEEVRQLLEARNARRVRRGQVPLDVEAELAALTRPSYDADPALVEEVRQAVEARNRRRARRGQEPLDVEAEVARTLSELG